MLSKGFSLEEPLDISGARVNFNGRKTGRYRLEWYKADLKENGTLQVTFNSHHSSIKLEDPDKHYTFLSGRSNPLSEADRQGMIERVASMQTERLRKAAQDKEERERKAQTDRARFSAASETGASKYFDRKQVTPHGVRFEKILHEGKEETVVLVPMIDSSGEIQSLQEIYDSKRLLGKDTKPRDKNFTNSTKGLYFTIGTITLSTTIHIAEGVATGLSVHEALGGKEPVIVAFNAGNLAPVVDSLTKKFPNNPIIIAADNDSSNPNNPGKIKAEEVSIKYGCKVVLPVFPEGKNKDDKGNAYTDFNDLHNAVGKSEVANQIRNNSYTQEQKEEETTEQENAEVEEPIISDRTFTPLSLEDLLNRPPKEMLIKRFFGIKELGMAYGEPGSGKTFVMISLLMSAGKGTPFARGLDVVRPLNVAYCAGEGVSGLGDRIKAAAQYHEVESLENVTFYSTVPQLYNVKGGHHASQTIAQFTKEWKERELKGEAQPLDVLIIDTFHSATVGAEENSAKEMGIVILECKKAIKELGCTVILVHHTDKGGNKERGSGSLRGTMDFMIEIKKSKSKSTSQMICSKLKDGEEWRPKSFEFHKPDGCNSVCVEWSESDVSLEECSLGAEKRDKLLLIDEMEICEHRMTCGELSEKVDKKNPHITKLLNELVSEGRCECILQDDKKPGSRWNPTLYFIQQ